MYRGEIRAYEKFDGGACVERNSVA